MKNKIEMLIDSFRVILMDEDTECGNEILCTTIAKKCAYKAAEILLDEKDGSDAHMEQETYPMFDLSIKKDVDTDINGAKYQAIRDAKNLLHGIGKNVFKMKIEKSHFDQEAINETGNRFNEGKLRWSLLDLKYLEGLVQVLMMGAKKYEDYNWQKGLPTIEIYESLMRHVIAWKSGEDKDAESGLDHIDHAICNLYFIKWMIANKPQFDTRKNNINEQDFEERKYPNENEK